MRTEKYLRNQISDLEDIIYDLKEEIFFLKKAIQVPLELPREWKLTKIHHAFVELLYTSKGLVTYDLIYHIIYGKKVNPPGLFTIHSHMHKVRKTLKPYGIEIISVRGEGFIMTDENTKIVTELIKESLKIETLLERVQPKNGG